MQHGIKRTRCSQTKINAVAKSVASQLAESKDKKYVVFHDAYQYFAESFVSQLWDLWQSATQPPQVRLA